MGEVGGELMLNFYCKLRNRWGVYMRGFFGNWQIAEVSVSVRG